MKLTNREIDDYRNDFFEFVGAAKNFSEMSKNEIRKERNKFVADCYDAYNKGELSFKDFNMQMYLILDRYNVSATGDVDFIKINEKNIRSLKNPIIGEVPFNAKRLNEAIELNNAINLISYKRIKNQSPDAKIADEIDSDFYEYDKGETIRNFGDTGYAINCEIKGRTFLPVSENLTNLIFNFKVANSKKVDLPKELMRNDIGELISSNEGFVRVKSADEFFVEKFLLHGLKENNKEFSPYEKVELTAEINSHFDWLESMSNDYRESVSNDFIGPDSDMQI